MRKLLTLAALLLVVGRAEAHELGIGCAPPSDGLGVFLEDVAAALAELEQPIVDKFNAMPECFAAPNTSRPKLHVVDRGGSRYGKDGPLFLWDVPDLHIDVTQMDDDYLEGIWADPGRLLVHELAHHFHMMGKPSPFPIPTNQDIVNDFLRIRYRALADALATDPRSQTLIRDLAQVEDKLRAAELGESERRRLEARRIELGMLIHLRHVELGLPSRFWGDEHSLNNDGAEYFAIAIELLAYDGERFCSSFSREEIAFLREKFGPCLEQLPAVTGNAFPACYFGN